MANIDWDDYNVSGAHSEKLGQEGTQTKLGRVVEETVVSYQTMGLAAMSVAAVGAGFLVRNGLGGFRVR